MPFLASSHLLVNNKLKRQEMVAIRKYDEMVIIRATFKRSLFRIQTLFLFISLILKMCPLVIIIRRNQKYIISITERPTQKTI